MSEKKKKKKTREEWFEQNVKKLNYLISLGFGLGVAERISDDEWTYIASEYTVDGILNNIENESQYCGCIFTYENQDMICILCDYLTFKLLDFKTMTLELPQDDIYCYFFHYDDYFVSQLQDISKDIKRIYVDDGFYSQYFTKVTMPKVNMPKGKKYNLDCLPYMEMNQLEKFERVVKLLKDNKGGQFQINHGNKYRIPKTILDMLSRPIFSLNERKVFERILLTITNSTFAITRCTSAPFIIKFKDFYKGLKLSRKSESIETIIRQCFDTLHKFGLVDTCDIDDNGNLTFYACSLAEKIKNQNIQREVGFYDNLPGTRQVNIIAAWLDYLYMINSFTRQNKELQIALDSLLAKLHLNHLLEQHRLKDIANIMNTLTKAGMDYSLISGRCLFNSNVVRDLLKDRQGMKECIYLMGNVNSSVDNNKTKENENG